MLRLWRDSVVPAILAAVLAFSAAGCNCDSCSDIARIVHRTTAGGPYDIELCIDGVCSNVVSLRVGGSASVDGDWSAQVWASAARLSESEMEIRISVDFYPPTGRRPAPAEYRVVIRPSDAPAIDETFIVSYDDEHTAGGCGVPITCFYSYVEI